MKRFMIVLALLLSLGLSNILAQTQAVATAIATVELGLLLEGTTDNDWGIMAPGESYLVTPAGFKEPPGPGETVGDPIPGIAPFFILSADAGAEVVFELIFPAGFLGTDSYITLPTSNWTYGLTYAGDPSSEPFIAYGPVVGNSAAGQVGGAGTLNLHLGATVTVPNNAPVDEYTAQVICTVIATGN